jgi:peptidyl-prolyl cis-trans isomerase SurA
MMKKSLKPMKTIFKLLAVACILMIPFLGSTQSRLDKQVLINIGNENVTVKEFMDVYNKNNINVEVIDKKSLEEYLNLYINFKLKVMEAEALKMDTSQSFINELEGYREQLAKPYFNDETVSEALLQEAYERKMQEVRAAHILIVLDKNANPADTLIAYNKIMQLRNRILEEGEDFGTVAAEASEDPSARDREAIPNQQPPRPGNKGDLGYFSVFDMVYPFENGAYNTPVGGVSMPVRSDFGYHIIKVIDRGPALGTIEAAHIYAAVPPDATEELILEKQDKINNIYQKIQEGMSFEDAAKQYSEDRGSAANNGLLNKFTVNRIVPEFVETIKTLKPGEVSEPIKTMYGFHIIKLIGLSQPGDFETEKKNLSDRLNRDARAQKSEEAVIKQIKKEANFKQFDKNLYDFISQIDSTLPMAQFDASEFKLANDPLFRIGKQDFTQTDFAIYLQEKQKPQQGMKAENYAYMLYNDFVNESVISYEDSMLEQKHPDFAMLMKEYRDGILLFDLMDQKVWSKAVKDTTGLKTFHADNQNKYMWDKRLSVTNYTITDERELEKASVIIKKYDDDFEIRDALAADSLRAVRIQPGKFEQGDNQFVDIADWQPGLYGPFSSDVDRFSVFVRVREVLDVQPKALNEARGLITSDYQNHLEEKWMEELRAKYPVTINQKVLEKVKNN